MAIVRVTWNDAQDHPKAWVDKEDAESFGGVDCTIVSVGFLVRKTDRYLTLAADWDGDDQDYGRVTKIPVSMLISVEELSP